MTERKRGPSPRGTLRERLLQLQDLIQVPAKIPTILSAVRDAVLGGSFGEIGAGVQTLRFGVPQVDLSLPVQQCHSLSAGGWVFRAIWGEVCITGLQGTCSATGCLGLTCAHET